MAAISTNVFLSHNNCHSSFINLYLKNTRALAQDEGSTGTCCIQGGAYCVVGIVIVPDAYYLSSGPCPGSGGGGILV